MGGTAVTRLLWCAALTAAGALDAIECELWPEGD